VGLLRGERGFFLRQSGLRFRALRVLGSPLLGAISERMVNHNYAVNFLLRLMTKDLAYAESEASGCGVHLKTSEAARGLFESAVAKGFGEEDMASVIEPLRVM